MTQCTPTLFDFQTLGNRQSQLRSLAVKSFSKRRAWGKCRSPADHVESPRSSVRRFFFWIFRPAFDTYGELLRSRYVAATVLVSAGGPP